VANPLDPEVRRAIRAYVGSVEQIEVLLAVREGPRTWSASELSEHLRLDATSVANRLTSLCAHGFLVEEGGRYRFAPVSSELASAAGALARAYAERKYSVMDEIFSRPRESDPVTVFANAFRLRRDDE
jgi:DNA-binding IclR family transcriptional regulator